MLSFGKTLFNITYHPVIENYKRYENISKNNEEDLSSGLSYYFLQGNIVSTIAEISQWHIEQEKVAINRAKGEKVDLSWLST